MRTRAHMHKLWWLTFSALHCILSAPELEVLTLRQHHTASHELACDGLVRFQVPIPAPEPGTLRVCERGRERERSGAWQGLGVRAAGLRPSHLPLRAQVSLHVPGRGEGGNERAGLLMHEAANVFRMGNKLLEEGVGRDVR